MDRGFKVQLCLCGPPMLINNTNLMCIFSVAQTQITSAITEKVALMITPEEWLVVTNIIFDRNKEKEKI